MVFGFGGRNRDALLERADQEVSFWKRELDKCVHEKNYWMAMTYSAQRQVRVLGAQLRLEQEQSGRATKQLEVMQIRLDTLKANQSGQQQVAPHATVASATSPREDAAMDASVRVLQTQLNSSQKQLRDADMAVLRAEERANSLQQELDAMQAQLKCAREMADAHAKEADQLREQLVAARGLGDDTAGQAAWLAAQLQEAQAAVQQLKTDAAIKDEMLHLLQGQVSDYLAAHPSRCSSGTATPRELYAGSGSAGPGHTLSPTMLLAMLNASNMSSSQNGAMPQSRVSSDPALAAAHAVQGEGEPSPLGTHRRRRSVPNGMDDASPRQQQPLDFTFQMQVPPPAQDPGTPNVTTTKLPPVPHLPLAADEAPLGSFELHGCLSVRSYQLPTDHPGEDDGLLYSSRRHLLKDPGDQLSPTHQAAPYLPQPPWMVASSRSKGQHDSWDLPGGYGEGLDAKEHVLPDGEAHHVAGSRLHGHHGEPDYRISGTEPPPGSLLTPLGATSAAACGMDAQPSTLSNPQPPDSPDTGAVAPVAQSAHHGYAAKGDESALATKLSCGSQGELAGHPQLSHCSSADATLAASSPASQSPTDGSSEASQPASAATFTSPRYRRASSSHVQGLPEEEDRASGGGSTLGARSSPAAGEQATKGVIRRGSVGAELDEAGRPPSNGGAAAAGEAGEDGEKDFFNYRNILARFASTSNGNAVAPSPMNAAPAPRLKPAVHPVARTGTSGITHRMALVDQRSTGAQQDE